MPVTLRDVAEQAGVSIGTASQALNHNPKVTAETRQRVIAAASDLGYHPKRRVQIYNTAKSDSLSVVGILTKHDVFDITLANPFYSYIYAGVEQECRRRGMSVMFSSVDVDEENHPLEWPPMIREGKIDALLLLGTMLEKAVDSISEYTDVPIILIDSYATGRSYDSIVTDNRGGAAQAVEHLIQLGHTRIGLIGSNRRSPQSILERREGYLQTMMKHGLDSEKYLIDTPLTRTGGADGMRWLLKHRSDITGVFVCNDDTATGVYQTINENGFSVPDDISVVGFDNTYICQSMTPTLTTINVPKQWMGALGVQALLERKLYPDKPKVTTHVDTELVIRKSTATPRS
jgi:DNA-binding LacI/PurR family transcriptional regulator